MCCCPARRMRQQHAGVPSSSLSPFHLLAGGRAVVRRLGGVWRFRLSVVLGRLHRPDLDRTRALPRPPRVSVLSVRTVGDEPAHPARILSHGTSSARPGSSSRSAHCTQPRRPQWPPQVSSSSSSGWCATTSATRHCPEEIRNDPPPVSSHHSAT